MNPKKNWPSETVIKRITRCFGDTLYCRTPFEKNKNIRVAIYIRLLFAISIDWYFATYEYSKRKQRKRPKTVIIRENVPTTLIRDHVYKSRERKHDFVTFADQQGISCVCLNRLYCENVPQ